MWLVYYSINGNRSWHGGLTREQLEEWVEENLDTDNFTCEDFYEIVDLKRMDLVEELKEAKDKLKKIKIILE